MKTSRKILALLLTLMLLLGTQSTIALADDEIVQEDTFYQEIIPDSENQDPDENNQGNEEEKQPGEGEKEEEEKEEEEEGEEEEAEQEGESEEEGESQGEEKDEEDNNDKDNDADKDDDDDEDDEDDEEKSSGTGRRRAAAKAASTTDDGIQYYDEYGVLQTVTEYDVLSNSETTFQYSTGYSTVTMITSTTFPAEYKLIVGAKTTIYATLSGNLYIYPEKGEKTISIMLANIVGGENSNIYVLGSSGDCNIEVYTNYLSNFKGKLYIGYGKAEGDYKYEEYKPVVTATPTYTITIPSTCNLSIVGETGSEILKGEIVITATDIANLDEGQYVSVTAASDKKLNSDYFTGYSLTYEMSADTWTFKNDGEGSCTITTGTPQAVGSYSGSITFTVGLATA